MKVYGGFGKIGTQAGGVGFSSEPDIGETVKTAGDIALKGGFLLAALAALGASRSSSHAADKPEYQVPTHPLSKYCYFSFDGTSLYGTILSPQRLEFVDAHKRKYTIALANILSMNVFSQWVKVPIYRSPTKWEVFWGKHKKTDKIQNGVAQNHVRGTWGLHLIDGTHIADLTAITPTITVETLTGTQSFNLKTDYLFFRGLSDREMDRVTRAREETPTYSSEVRGFDIRGFGNV